jgi:hypothetical protein
VVGRVWRKRGLLPLLFIDHFSILSADFNPETTKIKTIVGKIYNFENWEISTLISYLGKKQKMLSANFTLLPFYKNIEF